jgi:hypothetical protein
MSCDWCANGESGNFCAKRKRKIKREEGKAYDELAEWKIKVGPRKWISTETCNHYDPFDHSCDKCEKCGEMFYQNALPVDIPNYPLKVCSKCRGEKNGKKD